MKRMISALLCAFALCALLCVSVLAETTKPITFTSGDFEYILLPDGTAEIRKYKGEEIELTIPSELNGMKVSSIGDSAFFSCKSLISVIIPDSVMRIGERSFYNCSNLISISIPNSVTTIGDGAFYSCESLASIFIPDNVTTIGTNPFVNCRNLSAIEVSQDHPSLAVIDGVFFSKADQRLICYPMTKTDRNYTIPQGIILIGNDAFYSCKSLAAVTISDTVTTIGDGAFFLCESLVSVSIPNNVTSIGANPFAYCENLSAIKVSPDNPALAIIDGVLFSKADKRLICYPMKKADQNYVIPQGIRLIGDYAFYFCETLASVTIPDSVSTIGDLAFSHCKSLVDISIFNGVTTVGDGAFSHCKSLTSVSIPDSVTAIGDSAFFSCSNLAFVSIPNSVGSIGFFAFTWCSSGLTLTVPRDSYAAQYCQENDLNYTYPDSQDWLNQ